MMHQPRHPVPLGKVVKLARGLRCYEMTVNWTETTCIIRKMQCGVERMRGQSRIMSLSRNIGLRSAAAGFYRGTTCEC